jgi:hypothetical protein
LFDSSRIHPDADGGFGDFIMSYWRATRHPAPCLAFVLPLLCIYEFGVISVGGVQTITVRNGADAWLRWLLNALGPNFGLLAPVLIGIGLIYWALRRRGDAPKEPSTVVLGMYIESIGFAVSLWALSRSFGPMLDALGVTLSAAPDKSPTPVAQSVTFLGAGIYEEVIFRLGLYGGVAFILRGALVPKPLAILLAACLSAIAFATVHHLGARGEAVDGYVFAFRALAGLLFVGIYALRGFGVAVGAHACYDVLVGIAV